MWICQLGVENQSEIWVVLDLFLPNFDGFSFLYGVSAKQWVESRVNSFSYVLQKYWFASRYGWLENVQEAFLVEPQHVELTFFISVFHPFDALKLVKISSVIG